MNLTLWWVNLSRSTFYAKTGYVQSMVSDYYPEEAEALKDPMKIWAVVVTNGGMLHHDNIIFYYIKSHLIK